MVVVKSRRQETWIFVPALYWVDLQKSLQFSAVNFLLSKRREVTRPLVELRHDRVVNLNSTVSCKSSGRFSSLSMVLSFWSLTDLSRLPCWFTPRTLPLSQFFCRAVDLFTFHQNVFLCQPYQSCHKPASWQGERERRCFYFAALLCLPSFGIPAEKG